jgi:ABC-type nitrate/sulfonate/bicarbonate transport system substrate-binding protein
MAREISRRFLLAASASALASHVVSRGLPGGVATAAEAKVRMTTGLRATSHSIAWIGTEAGVFRKHGVDVSFPRLEVGGLETAAGLLRGDWQFVQTGTVPIAEAVLNGGDTVILLRNTVPNQVGVFIVARPEFTKLEQLGGKRVGVLVDPYSGQTSAMAHLTLEKAGVTATYVSLGTYRRVYEALRVGDVEAGSLPVDFRFLGESRYGWNSFETAPFGAPSVFATTRSVIASDRDMVLRVVRSVVETIHVFKTQPEVVVPLLQRYLNFDDRNAVERLYEFYAPLVPDGAEARIVRNAVHPRHLRWQVRSGAKAAGIGHC